MGNCADCGTQLHQSSLVIDTQPPRINCDLMLTDSMAAEAMRLVRRGVPRREVRVGLARMLVAEMRESGEVCSGYTDLVAGTGVTVSNTTQLGAAAPSSAFAEALEMTSSTRALVDVLEPDFQLITCAEDIRRVHSEGAHGVLMNLQNAAAFDDDLDRIEMFYNLGIRVVQLTYNRSNLLGGGCTDAGDPGLSYFGREVVRLLNESGIMIDLSHCGTRTAFDAMEVSGEPVTFTHTSAAAVCPHDRAKSDEQLRAVAETGGFVGVLLVPSFIQSGTVGSLRDFVRHVEHIAGLIGIEHVGIGTDTGRCYDWPADFGEPNEPSSEGARYARRFDWVGWRPEHRLGRGATIDGFHRWTDWPNITGALVETGFSDDEIRRLLGENFLRVFEAVVG